MALHRPIGKQGPIYQELAALALSLPRGARLPTVAVLCRQYRTTKTTIGRVLDRLEQMRLVRRRRGSGLYAGPAVGQKRVGVVFGGDIFDRGHSPYWLLLLQAAAQTAGEMGMQLHTYLDVTQAGKEWALHRQLAEDLASHRLDGLIACGMPPAAASWLSGQGVPLVGLRGARATIDHDATVQSGVAHLVACDCRRLAFMVKGGADEEAAFIRETARHGLLADHHRLWTYARCINQLPPVATMEAYGEAVVRRFWPLLAPTRRTPDGILIMDDTMARGVMHALDTIGVQVGTAVHVVTSAVRGSPVLSGFERRLSRLETDPMDEMRANFAMLDQALITGCVPEHPIRIRARLILPGGAA